MISRHALALLALTLFVGCGGSVESDGADTGAAPEALPCPNGFTIKLPGTPGATESAVAKNGRLQLSLARSTKGDCGDGGCTGIQVFRDGVSGDFEFEVDVVDVKGAGTGCGVRVFADIDFLTASAASLYAIPDFMNASVEVRGEGTKQTKESVGTPLHAGTLRIHRVGGTLTIESFNVQFPKKLVSPFPGGPVKVGIQLSCIDPGQTAATVTAIRLKDATGQLTSPLACAK